MISFSDTPNNSYISRCVFVSGFIRRFPSFNSYFVRFENSKYFLFGPFQIFSLIQRFFGNMKQASPSHLVQWITFIMPFLQSLFKNICKIMDFVMEKKNSVCYNYSVVRNKIVNKPTQTIKVVSCVYAVYPCTVRLLFRLSQPVYINIRDTNIYRREGQSLFLTVSFLGG